jgi:peptidase A4-like protein
VACVAVLAGAAPALADGGAPTTRGSAPRHTVGRSTSTNWSGYDVTGTGATHVVGTWTAQAVTCAPGESSWSSPWVGIDGDTSNTVEQIGTDSDCNRGAPYYYAWYEMYPKSLVRIAMTVTPGHSYTGEVTYTGASTYVLKLTDRTAGTSFQTTQASKKPNRASVEWILEGPTGSGLSDFGTIPFSSASGTINGQAGAIGALTGYQQITMVASQNSSVVRAQPSGLSAGGSAFSVTWQSS